MKVYTYRRLGAFGRLGNQLWEAAATIARAERAGPDARPSIPADWEYAKYVNLPEEFYDPPVIPGDRIIDAALIRGGPYFQELKYLEPLPRERIRGLFRPSAFALPRLGAMYGPMFEDIDLGKHCTALHVRRGDYLKHPDRFPQMTTRYWHHAVKAIDSRADVARAGGTTFLVFSDDIPWCLTHQEFLGIAGRASAFIEGHVRPVPVAARIGEPADIYDLWLMAQCQAHIISNSSFSWWGAYLSRDPSTIYPDRWFGDPALESTMWGCIPEGWEQVAC